MSKTIQHPQIDPDYGVKSTEVAQNIIAESYDATGDAHDKLVESHIGGTTNNADNVTTIRAVSQTSAVQQEWSRKKR